VIIASQRLIAVSRSRDVDHSPRSTAACHPCRIPVRCSRTVRSIRPATVFVCNLGSLGNPSIVTVFWPSLRHGRAASTVQESRERDRLAVRDGQQPIKSDPGAGLKNDWVTALLVALQLVMLVLLVTGQIR
jgi:hypothetical protein